MLPDRVSNPGPLTYESGALPIALRGPARDQRIYSEKSKNFIGSVSYCRSSFSFFLFILE